MYAGQFTPALVAEGTINPYRFIIGGAADNGGVEAGADAASVLGVSDGSVEDPLITSPVHATAGNHIHLQPGNIVKVECGAAVATQSPVFAAADGKATTTGTNRVGYALQGGGDGDIIRIVKNPIGE